MKKKNKAVNWDKLKSVGEVQHLKMSSGAFNNVLRLVRVGYSWADLCALGGGEGVIHSVAWYVDRHESAAESLAIAIEDGAKWREAKLSNEISSVDVLEDSAARVSRDKLRLSVLHGQKNKTLEKLGNGIGNAIIEAQQRMAGIEQGRKILDVTPTPEVLEPVNIDRQSLNKLRPR